MLPPLTISNVWRHGIYQLFIFSLSLTQALSPGRKILSWENISVRMPVGTFSWTVMDVEGSSSLWDGPPLGRWVWAVYESRLSEPWRMSVNNILPWSLSVPASRFLPWVPPLISLHGGLQALHSTISSGQLLSHLEEVNTTGQENGSSERWPCFCLNWFQGIALSKFMSAMNLNEEVILSLYKEMEQGDLVTG